MLSSGDHQKINHTQQKLIKERSQIMALNRAEISPTEIAAFTGRHISTIARWEKRIEQGETLQDRSRTGCPATFSELIKLKLCAFFCQFPPLPGCNSITLKWAEQYFNQNPGFLGCPISASSISRILRQHPLRPHLHKYFLQITDENFFDIMPLIVKLYLNPPENLFAFDECPGIQALRTVAPPLPAGTGKGGKKYSEPNHNRMGTTDLYAFFNVNRGNVFAQCNENHRVETLIQIFRAHVATLSDAAIIHYICDNLSNHSCHEFCRVVAELSNVHYPEPELDTKEKRQQWLQQENQRIIIHFTPKHGSWLNIVEIWFGILGQKCLKYNSFISVDDLVAFIDDFIETWNQYFAHPFNWTYDGSGLHGTAVRRFITHIAIENKYMELDFLSKQMHLMLNLLQNYFKQVNIKDWIALEEIIEEKKIYINNIIKNSDKPRIKKKAEELVPKLLEVLKNKLQANIKKAA